MWVRQKIWLIKAQPLTLWRPFTAILELSDQNLSRKLEASVGRYGVTVNLVHANDTFNAMLCLFYSLFRYNYIDIYTTYCVEHYDPKFWLQIPWRNTSLLSEAKYICRKKKNMKYISVFALPYKVASEKQVLFLQFPFVILVSI